MTEAPPEPVQAAGKPRRQRGAALSRRLLDIDRDLRARLETECDLALEAALVKAGNRVASRAQGNSAARPVAADTPRRALAATLGRPLVAALGLTDDELLDGAFAALAARYALLTAAAQEAVLADLARTLSLPESKVETMAATQTARREGAAERLLSGMIALAKSVLYAAHPAGQPDILPPATSALVRQVVSYAGGGSSGRERGVQTAGAEHYGGVGTGGDVGVLLRTEGARDEGYEWVYGISRDRFHPHVALTGIRVSSFEDPKLLNPSGFRARRTSPPGDHKGCSCDLMPLWALKEDDQYDPRPGESDRPTDGSVEDANERDLERRLETNRAFPTDAERQRAQDAIDRGRDRNAREAGA